MKIEPISFYTGDKLQLFGLLYLPEERTNKVMISIHGITSNCMKERDFAIAEKVTKQGIAYFGFSNRGHDIVNVITKFDEGKRLNVLQGSSMEDIQDSYYDIVAAIKKTIEKGYSHIYLQGHSLGCTKLVYTYHQLQQEESEILEKIDGIVLLSMVDIVTYAMYTFGKENIAKIVTIAEKLEKEQKIDSLLPLPQGTPPCSVRTFLRYARDYKQIDFARYRDEKYEYPELNAISIPLFMRWGELNELITQKVNDLVDMMKEKIHNEKLDIGFIEGTSHNYTKKEKELADEITRFLMKNR